MTNLEPELELTPTTEEQQPNKKEPKAHQAVFEYLEIIAFTLIVVLLLNCVFFMHVVVDGSSMYDTLEDGEHLIISAAFYTPKQGDIVVFESEEETGLDKALIKRVIATENQTIRIYPTYITVDGVVYDDEHAYFGGSSSYYEDDQVSYLKRRGKVAYTDPDNGLEYIEYKTGENQAFLMGDNRYNSNDSRFFGAISYDHIFGKVLLRITPFSKFGKVD